MRYILLLLSLLFAQGVCAEQILRLVNDEVISDYDVSERLALRRIFEPQLSDNKSVRQQILEDLTNEKVKIYAAQQLNVEVSDAEVEQAISYLEQQNHLQPHTLKKRLAEKGVPMETLKAQTRADLLWLRYMQRKKIQAPPIPQSRITKLQDEMKKDMSADRYLLSAIYIPYGKSKEQAEQKAKEVFDNIVKGDSFSQTAQQYSSGKHAKDGGDLGWVKADSLDALLQKVVEVMNVGQLSKPVAGKSGYYIALLREKMPGMTSSEITSINLSQILVPYDKAAMAVSAAQTTKNCQQFNEVAKTYGGEGSGPVGEVVLERVPPEIARVLTDTPLSKPSAPIETPNEVVIFMKCSQRQVSVLPDEQVLRQKLEMEELDKKSTELLQQLRQQMVIE